MGTRQLRRRLGQSSTVPHPADGTLVEEIQKLRDSLVRHAQSWLQVVQLVEMGSLEDL